MKDCIFLFFHYIPLIRIIISKYSLNPIVEIAVAVADGEVDVGVAIFLAG